MKILSGLLARAYDLGVLDEITEDGSSVVLSSGTRKLTIESSTGSDGTSYLLWGSDKPDQIYEVLGPRSEVLASRLVMQYFMGLTNGKFNGKLYTNALLVPVEQTSDGLVLSSADGTKYIILSEDAGGNNGNITLGFFDIVYDQNGEHWAMQLPQLYARDKIKISEVKASAQLPLTLEGIMSGLPTDFRSLAVCPRLETVPQMGTAIQSGVVVTSSDGKNIIDMNKTLHTAWWGTETVGYTIPVLSGAQLQHLDLTKEIVKSDGFQVKMLDGGQLQLNCVRRYGNRELYSQFTAMTNAFKLEPYISACGVTAKQLKSGIDLSSIPEAKKLKDFLVSSAKLTPLSAPQIQRSLCSQCLVGEQGQKRLQELGFDTSIGILKSVRQIVLDGQLPKIE